MSARLPEDTAWWRLREQAFGRLPPPLQVRMRSYHRTASAVLICQACMRVATEVGEALAKERP